MGAPSPADLGLRLDHERGCNGHEDPEGDGSSLIGPWPAESIASLIDVDLDDEHRRTLAHGIVGLAEGTGRHWIDDELDLDPDILGKQVADLAYAGLRGVRRL